MNNTYLKKDLTFAEGICGNEVFWKIENDTLFIYGNGEVESKFSPWYGYRFNIKKVVVEEGVTAIGAHAFYYCENLETVNLADTVKSIGDAAFYACNALRHINIPAAMNKLPEACFNGCDAYRFIKKRSLFERLTLRKKCTV